MALLATCDKPLAQEMEITEIRRAVTEDQASQLRPIFVDAFGEPPSDSFLERLNEKGQLSVLLAHSGDLVIGFKIGYTRFKGVFFSWLGAVAPGHRRRGVARRLIQHQHRLCAERGYHELQTEALASNQAMLILNLEEGFEVGGVHLGRDDALTVQLRKRLDSSKSYKGVAVQPAVAVDLKSE
ncbi:MAG: ribosomal protein S18 acetylase RimI-like enzyme [Verrucomicrobiales bacterium]